MRSCDNFLSCRMSPSCNPLCLSSAGGRFECANAGATEEEHESVDLEAVARDVWEDGDRLADLSSKYAQEHTFNFQESLLHVLQRHIASLTPDQAQVLDSALSCSLRMPTMQTGACHNAPLYHSTLAP